VRFAAALLLVGCSAVPPDPAIGTWLCAERWLGAARAECPVDGASWQLDLGPEGAVFIEAFIDPAIEPVIVPLDTVPLELGSWQLTESAVEGVESGQLELSCVYDGPLLSCAGSDAQQTWELRFTRI